MIPLTPFYCHLEQERYCLITKMFFFFNAYIFIAWFGYDGIKSLKYYIITTLFRIMLKQSLVWSESYWTTKILIISKNSEKANKTWAKWGLLSFKIKLRRKYKYFDWQNYILVGIQKVGFWPNFVQSNFFLW